MESVSQFSQVELARIGHAALSSRKMGIAEALAAARPRQAARGPEFSNAPRSDFRRFSDDLYCSGAVEQKCLVGNHRSTAGQCLWYKPQRSLLGAGWAAVTDDDMNATLTPRSALAHHRFDPVRGGAASYGYRHFGRDAAARCVAGKRILVAGDSTTRDTYYELLVVGGHPERVSVPSAPDAYWPPSAYAPRDPGPDRQGRCMGNFDKRVACVRDYRGNATRLAFQFLMRTNASWELDDARKLLAQDGGPPVDAAFVHCPVYEWFKPDAYDYTKTKEQRARVVKPELGARHLEAMGRSCMQYVEEVVWRLWPSARVFLLGQTPMPQWTRDMGSDRVEARIFHSVNAGVGVKCRLGADGRYDIASRRGIVPIDRYSLVGPRRRDAIHPFFSAQFAVVQLMLNHLCGDA